MPVERCACDGSQLAARGSDRTLTARKALHAGKRNDERLLLLDNECWGRATLKNDDDRRRFREGKRDRVDGHGNPWSRICARVRAWSSESTMRMTKK